MSVTKKIGDSVTAATGLPFYYDTPQTLNIRLDKATFPCAMMNILQSGTIVENNAIIKERLNIEVIFAQKSRLDFDGMQVEEFELDAMKEKAFEWLLSLFRSRDLKLVSLNGTQRYYATEDVIYSAYGVNITIEERQGVSICNLKAKTDDETE